MPLEKLNAFTKKVSDLADKPNATMTAAEVKAQFDAAPDEVRVYLNKLIDDLQSKNDGNSGADNIGVTAIPELNGNTVQSILESLKELDDSNREYLLSQIGNVVIGQIPDGSLTDIKLSNNPADIKQRVTAHLVDYTQFKGDLSTLKTNAKDSIPNIVNELFTNVSDGKLLVGGAITDVDHNVVIPTDPTFIDLAEAISRITLGMTINPGEISLYTDSLESSNFVQPHTPQKRKSVIINIAGKYRVSYQAKVGRSSTQSCTSQLYINGIAKGILRNLQQTYVTYTEEFDVKPGDELSIYANVISSVQEIINIQGFELKGDTPIFKKV